jgi:hypothetical protein
MSQMEKKSNINEKKANFIGRRQMDDIKEVKN